MVHLLLVIISNKSSFDKPKFYLQQNSTNVHISEWCNIEISFKFRYYVIKYTVNCHFFLHKQHTLKVVNLVKASFTVKVSKTMSIESAV